MKMAKKVDGFWLRFAINIHPSMQFGDSVTTPTQSGG